MTVLRTFCVGSVAVKFSSEALRIAAKSTISEVVLTKPAWAREQRIESVILFVS